MVNNKKSSSRKSKKTTKTTKSFLHSKLVLYLSLVLFIFNILAFLFFKDMQSLFLLLIVLFITYLLDQNMIIVLMVPMLFVGTLILLRKSFIKRDLIEGMEGKKKKIKDDNEENEENEANEENEENVNEDDEDETYANINSSTDELKSNLNELVSNYEKVQKDFNESIENSKLDPQSLEAQKAVIKQMNAITPLIKDSVSILNKVDVNGLNKFLGSFSNLIGTTVSPQPVSSSTKV